MKDQDSTTRPARRARKMERPRASSQITARPVPRMPSTRAAPSPRGRRAALARRTPRRKTLPAIERQPALRESLPRFEKHTSDDAACGLALAGHVVNATPHVVLRDFAMALVVRIVD